MCFTIEYKCFFLSSNSLVEFFVSNPENQSQWNVINQLTIIVSNSFTFLGQLNHGAKQITEILVLAAVEYSDITIHLVSSFIFFQLLE